MLTINGHSLDLCILTNGRECGRVRSPILGRKSNVQPSTELTMHLVSVNAITPQRSVIHFQIPNGCNRVFVFIAGFGQGTGTWDYMRKYVTTNQTDGVVLIGRRGEEQRRYVGLMSLSDQIDEVDEALTWLIRHHITGLPITPVGHSVGGLIAREVAARHIDRIFGLVQIAPVPVQRFAMLKHWSFWRHGGILAALAAPLGVMSRRGFIPPSSAVQGLFTGEIDEDDLLEYRSRLVPDSVRVFAELMCFYDGRKTWNFLKEHLQGPNTIVVAPADTTIPRKALEAMNGRRVDIKYLSGGTPHCIQFAHPRECKFNADILKEVLRIKTTAARIRYHG